MKFRTRHRPAVVTATAERSAAGELSDPRLLGEDPPIEAIDPLAFDYQDRQRIAVVPDHIAVASRVAEMQASEGDRHKAVQTLKEALDKPDWRYAPVPHAQKQPVRSTARRAFGELPVDALSLAANTSFLGHAKEVFDEAKDDAWTWWEERRLATRILMVGESEISSLIFPPSHPQLETIYIGNPVDQARYYLAAEFHQETFEHKTAELMRLLAHLGATDIVVNAEFGWRRGRSGKLTASKFPWRLNAVLRDRLQGGRTVERRRHLTPARPALPDGLHWYNFEQEWKDLAELRLQNRVKADSVHVAYTKNYGVDAKLTAKVAKLGFDLGGKFESQVDTQWRVDVAFDDADLP